MESRPIQSHHEIFGLFHNTLLSLPRPSMEPSPSDSELFFTVPLPKKKHISLYFLERWPVRYLLTIILQDKCFCLEIYYYLHESFRGVVRGLRNWRLFYPSRSNNSYLVSQILELLNSESRWCGPHHSIHVLQNLRITLLFSSYAQNRLFHFKCVQSFSKMAKSPLHEAGKTNQIDFYSLKPPTILLRRYYQRVSEVYFSHVLYLIAQRIERARTIPNSIHQSSRTGL